MNLQEIVSASVDALESGELKVPTEAEIIGGEIDPITGDAVDPVDPGAAGEQDTGADDGDGGAPADGEKQQPDADAGSDDAGSAPPAQEQQAIQDGGPDEAPTTWKKEVAEKWKELPAEIKAEIKRREEDYHRGIERYKPAVQFGQAMHQAVAPYEHNLRASGVPAPQAINHLMRIEDSLRNGDQASKVQTLLKIAADYGIDMQQAVKTQPDPRMWQIEQQLHQERMARLQFQSTIEQQQNGMVMGEIEKFAADPKNEHYPVVRGDMAALLQSGMASDLKDAYDKAVWARPDLRQSLIAKAQTEAEQKALQQAQSKRAKSAAVGVKGGTPGAGNVKPGASLHEIVEAAMDGTLK